MKPPFHLDEKGTEMRNKISNERLVELARRVNRDVRLDAIHRRATVVPSKKRYKRRPKHRRGEDQ